MIQFTYHAQDHYSIAIFEDGYLCAGSTFHTRADAEAYAAPLIAQGYTARGTAPSYDRVYLDSISRANTISERMNDVQQAIAELCQWEPSDAVSWERVATQGRAYDAELIALQTELDAIEDSTARPTTYTGRPYRQGDAIETDDIDPGFGDEF